MEARAHPRSSIRLKTDLVCVHTHSCHERYIRNISLGGVFVAGAPCGAAGMEFSVVIKPLGKPIDDTSHYPARIVRTVGDGFALRFNPLSDGDNRALRDLVEPRWDGRNVIEGLLIVAAREQVMDLSECLRLTSVICDRYRRICVSNNSKR